MALRLYARILTVCMIFMPMLSHGQLSADFHASVQSGCAPVVVHYTDNSAGNPVQWQWDLGNGTYSTSQNPSTTYVLPGNYTVSLTVYDVNGTSKTTTRTNYINISPTPEVSFYASDSLDLCPPATINFTNTTNPVAPGPANYTWDFGDGNSSNLPNPSHTYTATGNYTVTLVATNSVGCSGIRSRKIQIVNKPKADFSSVDSIGCTIPLSARFTNTSTNASSYTWDFGDGSTSTSSAATVNYTYTSAGNYTVKLIARNSSGCADTLVRTNYIRMGRPTAGFNLSSNTICAGTSVSFTNTSTGASSYRWDYDGISSTATTPPARTFNTAGTYTIRLIANQGTCSDTLIKQLTVIARPVSSFTADSLAGCRIPHTVKFNNTSTGANSYVWTLSPGVTSTVANPTFTYNTTGNYTVTLTAISSAGCSTASSQTVRVARPIPNISVLPQLGGCINEVLRFSASVTSPPYPISVYRWDFGDGTVATGQNVTHAYAMPGVYNVILTATTTNGCVFTQIQELEISSKPTAGFIATPQNVCLDDEVIFTNTSTGANRYRWVFGDGKTAQVEHSNPVPHLYHDTGQFTITLIAWNKFCTDTLLRPRFVYVNGPAALFTPVYDCADRLSVSFINNSQRAVSYDWDFGDGNQSTQQLPAHTYASEGAYTIRLIVTDVYGCHDTALANIELRNQPTVDFTVSDSTICKGESVAFTRIGPAVPRDYTYRWSFGLPPIDNNASATINKVYNTAGVYDVSLMVTDKYTGCVDTFTKQSYMRVGAPVPEFVISPDPAVGCNPLTINFSDNSTAPGSTVTERIWTFGDGAVLGGNNSGPSHTYNSLTRQSYSVKLVVKDANGCSDSVTKNNIVQITRPSANFTHPATICVNQPLNFNNTSLGAVYYIWDFGDGSTSAAIDPVHTYVTEGVYTVRLIAINSDGCRDTLIKSNAITVNKVVAGFTVSDSIADCPPLVVQFTNTSTGANAYNWSFGNGISSTLTDPTSVYTAPGVYPVVLRAYGNGCSDSATFDIRVQGPNAQGSFNYSPVSGCVPLTVNFSAVAVNTTQYSWDMNNGTTGSTTTGSFSYTFTEPGEFLPVLVLSNSANCDIAVVGLDTIKVYDIKGEFSVSADAFCVGVPLQFHDTVTNFGSLPITRFWDFDDGNTSSQEDPIHTFSAAGTYDVQLIVFNGNNCTDTFTHRITIHDLPNVTVTSNPPVICTNDFVQLQAAGAIDYSWSPATDLSCTNCSNPSLRPTAPLVYTVTGTDMNGCADTASINVAPGVRPQITVSSDTTVCFGEQFNLVASGAAAFEWSPATDLSCSNCPSPIVTPTATTTYRVVGTNNIGCTDTAYVTVTVNPLPVLNLTPSQSICNQTSIQLSVSGANAYNWSPGTGLSCTTCPDPIASPPTTTTYTVEGTDLNGCTDTGRVTITVDARPQVLVFDRDVCVGDTVILRASGAVSYNWSPATGLSCTNCDAPVASPAATTTYTVVGAFAGGCADTTTVTVTVNPLPTIAVGADTAICLGESVSLKATGGVDYSWTPAAGLSCINCDDPIATPSNTTTYVVGGKDAKGCINYDTVEVRIKPLPAVDAGMNRTICHGDTIQLLATGAVSYNWDSDPGLSCLNCPDPIAKPAGPTTYRVTGTDADGCSLTDSILISFHPTPVLNLGGDREVCIGDTLNLRATGGLSYQWSPATGLSCTNCDAPVASPTTTTTYSVVGTFTGGCIDSGKITVTVNPLPEIKADTDTAICLGESVSMKATGGASYSWSPGAGLSCINCDNPIASPIDTTEYIVRGVDAKGCVNFDTVVVRIMPLPVVDAGINRLVCRGDTVHLSASGASSYTWDNIAGLSCLNCPDPIAMPVTPTNYRVVGVDTNGCIASALVSVGFHAQPVLSGGGNRDLCIGDTLTLFATGGNNYSWSPATDLSCTNCPSPLAWPSTTTTYTLKGASQEGCWDSVQVTVTVHPTPIVSAGADREICLGESTTLTGSGAANYSWSPAAGLSCVNCTSPVASPTATTVYQVIGTTAVGCRDSAEVTVKVNPLPVLETSGSTIICKGDSTVLSVSGASQYNWTPAAGLSCTNCPQPIASPQQTTTYTVTGVDSIGCVNTSQVEVRLNNDPVISAGADITICQGEFAQLQATGGISYQWSPATGLSCVDCPDPIASPEKDAYYIVTGVDANGCRGMDSIFIKVVQPVATSVGADVTICEGQSAQLSASGGVRYSWSPVDGLSCVDCSSPVASPDSSTNYQVIISNNVCFADTLYQFVEVLPMPTVDLGPDLEIFAGEQVRLFANSRFATKYEWTPAQWLSCDDCISPTATPEQSITYEVRAYNEGGCSTSDKINIKLKCDGSMVFVPNTFTPNGDGQNDLFFPHANGISTIEIFRVYSRWGEVVFERTNMPVNDPGSGWDGRYKGRVLNPDTYIYMLQATCVNGGKITLRGDVSLIR